MLMNAIKLLLCLVAVTFAFNAQAVYIAELDETSYEWVEATQKTGVSQMLVAVKLSDKPATLYEYEYTSRELEQDLSHSYAPWFGSNEWHSDNATVNSAKITTSDVIHKDSTPSVKVLLLIISGFIGILGLTKDRSEL